jgi:hypothetical protein
VRSAGPSTRPSRNLYPLKASSFLSDIDFTGMADEAPIYNKLTVDESSGGSPSVFVDAYQPSFTSRMRFEVRIRLAVEMGSQPRAALGLADRLDKFGQGTLLGHLAKSSQFTPIEKFFHAASQPGPELNLASYGPLLRLPGKPSFQDKGIGELDRLTHRVYLAPVG